MIGAMPPIHDARFGRSIVHQEKRSLLSPMLHDLSQLAEAYILKSLHRKESPKALLVVTTDGTLAEIPLRDFRIARRDALDFHRWFNGRLKAVAYAYITSVMSVVDENDPRPELNFMVRLADRSKAIDVSYPIKSLVNMKAGKLEPARRVELQALEMASSPFYFFRPADVNLFKIFRFNREAARLWKQATLSQWTMDRQEQENNASRSFGSWGNLSPDQPLLFEGRSLAERLHSFAEALEVAGRTTETAAKMSLAAMSRMNYLAPKPFGTLQAGLALLALTDSISDWFDVDWDETALLAFGMFSTRRLLETQNVSGLEAIEEGVSHGASLQVRAGDLFNAYPELSMQIGRAVRIALIQSDEQPLSWAAAKLSRTSLD